MPKKILQYLVAVLVGAGLGLIVANLFWNVPRQSLAAEPYIQKNMQSCWETGAESSCYKQAAKDFLDNFTLRQILEVFEKNEQLPEFFSRCHETSHYLGQLAFQKLGSVREVFLQSTYACLAGAFHGAVEGYFMEKGLLLDGTNFDAVSKYVPLICGKSEDYEIPQQFTECNHGLGHALMYATDNDLLEALKLCDVLGTQNERELCYTGALMQNADSADSLDHPSKYVKTDDPLYPCNILGKQYQRQCYTYGILSEAQSDTKKSIELCSSVPHEYQGECFQTYGRDRTMISADPATIKNQCEEIASQESRNECIKGAAYNLVVRFGPESSLGAEFCRLVSFAPHKDDCYSQLERALANQTKDIEEKKTFCQSILEENYKEACLNNVN